MVMMVLRRRVRLKGMDAGLRLMMNGIVVVVV